MPPVTTAPEVGPQPSSQLENVKRHTPRDGCLFRRRLHPKPHRRFGQALQCWRQCGSCEPVPAAWQVSLPGPVHRRSRALCRQPPRSCGPGSHGDAGSPGPQVLPVTLITTRARGAGPERNRRGPDTSGHSKLVGPERFELSTNGLKVHCSSAELRARLHYPLLAPLERAAATCPPPAPMLHSHRRVTGATRSTAGKPGPADGRAPGPTPPPVRSAHACPARRPR